MSFFEAKGITKSYEGTPIVSDIDLEIAKGELVSLLGKSGVGKTTLFQVLSGLEAPDDGSVWFEGEEITGIPGKVGYMQQKDLLLPFKKLIDNLALPLLLKSVPTKEAYRRVLELLPIFGLGDAAALYPSQLSGGMRQRAALLRSFLFSEKMLLLDEPFSALDAITKTSLLSWFNAIRIELKLTCLLVSHDIEEALLLSDRLYVLSGQPGRLHYEMSLNFPGPRDAELTLDAAFIEKKRELLHVLESS